MTKRINIIGSKQPLIRDTSTPQPRIDPAMVAKALGAARMVPVPKNLPPHAMAMLHRSLFQALRSSGGRPGIEGAELRPKIPMTAEDWSQLEAIAAELAGKDGFAPTPGQVGSQILHDALARLRDRQSESADDKVARTYQVAPPPALGAREPTAAYAIAPRSSVRAAARRHLQQAQVKSETRTA